MNVVILVTLIIFLLAVVALSSTLHSSLVPYSLRISNENIYRRVRIGSAQAMSTLQSSTEVSNCSEGLFLEESIVVPLYKARVYLFNEGQDVDDIRS